MIPTHTGCYLQEKIEYHGTTIISSPGGVRQTKLGAASTLSACCAACRRNPICDMFSFDNRAKLCYLKASHGFSKQWFNADFTSGLNTDFLKKGTELTCALGGCYNYIGCYKDSSNRVIPTKLSLKDNAAVTVYGCAAAALTAGYRCATPNY